MKRRKLKRRHLIYYLRIYDQSSSCLLGHLVDINTAGIKLMSENLIEVGKSFKCEIVLPTEFGGHKRIVFDAYSIWCKKDINPDFYATGFEISNISRDDINLIEVLIDEFGFRD